MERQAVEIAQREEQKENVGGGKCGCWNLTPERTPGGGWNLTSGGAEGQQQ